ncbi:MAG: multidrug DMT transporter permease [Afipia sp. 62-7]|nr:DMT family transporter [Afipia sp.]OJU20796.1 MAG: multidrug DMT transporter permease [Afipia sp. 62-7]
MSIAVPLFAPKSRSTRLPFQIALFCVVWSLSFAVAKVALADCPPLLLLMTRFLLAGLVMLAFAALRPGEMALTRRNLLAFAAIGIANNAMYLGLGYVGLRTVSAGLGTLVVSANPVLTAVLASVFLGERLTWQKVAGLVLGVGGVGFIVAHRLSVATGQDSPTGLVFTFCALLSIVAGTILYKKLAPQGGMLIGNAVQNLAGGLVLVPFAVLFESVSDIVPSGRLLLSLAYLTLLGSIVGYLLWQYLIGVMGATAASSYHFLMPPLGVLFGWLLVGEHVSSADILGIIPVALGIYLVSRPATDRSLASNRKKEI